MYPRTMASRAAGLAACVFALAASASRYPAAAADGGSTETRTVAGQGVHYLTTVIVHSTEPTPIGMVQRSTETVELTGDLSGRVLYHPTSVFDFASGTLVNTGEQVFSGTVLGSAPVLLYDDQFRFEANLATGAVRGEVHFTDRLAGPKVQCDLVVIGTGAMVEGNAAVEYSGECRLKTE